MDNIYNVVKLDEHSVTHKYLQISNCVIDALREKKIEVNYPLPSINEMSFELDISRDTVEKAYRHLKRLQIVDSVPGKGYYIMNSEFNRDINVFLLFNKLSLHKKILYDSFVARLGEQASIDFYIYHNDYNFFKKLIANIKQNYSHYVIIPHFVDGGNNSHEILNTLPSEKLILLDKLVKGVEGNYAAVYENFKDDLYEALLKAGPLLENYQQINLIFPSDSYYPVEILDGFHQYCREYEMDYSVIHNICKAEIKKGQVYINVMEDDLVVLIEKLLAAGLKAGVDVGILSYNETPLKKIILNGISTISTDFKLMGRKTADIILSKTNERFAVPFKLTLRESL